MVPSGCASFVSSSSSLGPLPPSYPITNIFFLPSFHPIQHPFNLCRLSSTGNLKRNSIRSKLEEFREEYEWLEGGNVWSWTHHHWWNVRKSGGFLSREVPQCSGFLLGIQMYSCLLSLWFLVLNWGWSNLITLETLPRSMPCEIPGVGTESCLRSGHWMSQSASYPKGFCGAYRLNCWKEWTLAWTGSQHQAQQAPALSCTRMWTVSWGCLDMLAIWLRSGKAGTFEHHLPSSWQIFCWCGNTGCRSHHSLCLFCPSLERSFLPLWFLLLLALLPAMESRGQGLVMCPSRETSRTWFFLSILLCILLAHIFTRLGLYLKWTSRPMRAKI